MEGGMKVKREIDYYNLDAIISVGYRINFSQTTQFRILATQILKDHPIRGYTTNEKRFAERGVKELKQSSTLAMINNISLSKILIYICAALIGWLS